MIAFVHTTRVKAVGEGDCGIGAVTPGLCAQGMVVLKLVCGVVCCAWCQSECILGEELQIKESTQAEIIYTVSRASCKYKAWNHDDISS